MKKSPFFSLILSFFLFECAAPSIRFKSLAPAPVNIPREIQSIALIDRTTPENNLLNVLEGGITGEGIGQDKLASQITLDGVRDILQGSDRYYVVRTSEMLKGSRTGTTFPDPLSWDVIRDLTKKYDVDVILSLETFDSDFIVTNGTRTVTKKVSENKSIPMIQFFANGVATVNMGFRLYDPVDMNILDQFHFSHNQDWQSHGNSINDAIRQLLNKNAAVKEVAYDAGVMYARRITPSWYMIVRTYYNKAKHNPDLEEGGRMMEANDWDAAIDALNRALENGNRKSRGKAAHNLAVVYEILGDFATAKTWAQQAWGKYENKESRNYAYLLNQRIREQETLQDQLGN